ncbi:MAG TPA: polysaccharide deacetylase family protein [Solirubrobacteraceae bacterium]|nr:polysaccharide deacetylase family protein [Solirubrobacteraceae bacterium]
MNAGTTCSLTFDDGPDPVWTPRVLDCLGRHQARSTFFVMADRAWAHADLIERIHREGHEVELHCMRHVRHTELQEPALRADTEQGLRTLARLGARVRRWRPPWGVVTEVTRRVARENQLEVVGWSVDTEDWRGDSAAWMHDRVEDDLGAGAVVLMHDGIGPGARRAGCRETVELIPRLLATLADRGLALVPLSENAGYASLA